MLDLSNNNGTRHNFKATYVKGGQRRVYLKQGEDIVMRLDPTYRAMRKAALAAGFKVGPYWFCHPGDLSPRESLDEILHGFFAYTRNGRELRLALDLERGTPTRAKGVWARELWTLARRETGIAPATYGNGYYLEALRLPAPIGPLWLAAYGRNDGREYPVGKIPAPWKQFAGHQFTSRARIVGIDGDCDLTHLRVLTAFDVPRRR